MTATTQNDTEYYNARCRAKVEEIADQGRDAVIKAIRGALRDRSGKAWSVTGGRGTAWGWITIDAPPARRTARFCLKIGAVTMNPEDYELVDTGQPHGSMTEADQQELARLMGDARVHHQGRSIPASRDHQRVALAQALYGDDLGFTSEQYWD